MVIPPFSAADEPEWFKEEVMGKGRSLTKTEWTAQHTLGVLRKMLLVPDEPHDYVEVGDIKRVEAWQEKTGKYSDIRERTIAYGWRQGWRSVSITLRKEVVCGDAQDAPPLSDDKEYPWSVERIEIKGQSGSTGKSGYEQREGVILFPDRAAVNLLYGHLTPPDRQGYFY